MYLPGEINVSGEKKSVQTSKIKKLMVFALFCCGVPALVNAGDWVEPPVSTVERVYEATLMQSQWKNKPSSRLYCELSHEVPDYGMAIFSQKAGHSMTFGLRVMGPQVVKGEAKSQILPPNWRLGARVQAWDSFPTQSTKQPFQLDDVKSQQLLTFLKTGLDPAFDFQDVAGSLRVVLSAVRFQQPYREYSACLQDLLTFAFEDIASRIIFFGPGSSELSLHAMELLDQMALYYAVDPSIRTIHLVGHSDNQAKRRDNYLMSLARVDTVQQYLLKHGIPTEKIVTDAFGEREPVASNDTDEGRAKNRRVNITLEKY